MPYHNQIIDLFNQRNPMFNQGSTTDMFNRTDIWSGRRDISPQSTTDPRYRNDPRDRQGMALGDPRDRQGMALGDPREKKKRVIGGKGKDRKYNPYDPKYYNNEGYQFERKKKRDDDDDDDDGLLTWAEWQEENPDGSYKEYLMYLGMFEGDPGGDLTGDFDPDPEPRGTVAPPSWMSGPGLPNDDILRFFETGGEDTRRLPRGFGTDWFRDLNTYINDFMSGDWSNMENKKKMGTALSIRQTQSMMNIMNRIANQGILGTDARKFILSGEKRESTLRRKELRKRLQRTLGRDLGGRAGGAATNMMFNQVDAPDFARREGKAAELREFDMKSRMAGVEGNSQLLNLFESWALGEQVQSKGGPGALQTIGDVAQIAKAIAAIMA